MWLSRHLLGGGGRRRRRQRVGGKTSREPRAHGDHDQEGRNRCTHNLSSRCCRFPAHLLLFFAAAVCEVYESPMGARSRPGISHSSGLQSSHEPSGRYRRTMIGILRARSSIIAIFSGSVSLPGFTIIGAFMLRGQVSGDAGQLSDPSTYPALHHFGCRIQPMKEAKRRTPSPDLQRPGAKDASPLVLRQEPGCDALSLRPGTRSTSRPSFRWHDFHPFSSLQQHNHRSPARATMDRTSHSGTE